MQSLTGCTQDSNKNFVLTQEWKVRKLAFEMDSFFHVHTTRDLQVRKRFRQLNGERRSSFYVNGGKRKKSPIRGMGLKLKLVSSLAACQDQLNTRTTVSIDYYVGLISFYVV